MPTETYIYLSIPIEYKCVYDKLLVKLSNLGIDMLKECNTPCKTNNKNIINCWNIFQTACAAYALGEYSKATLLINYIKAQMDIICDVQEKTNNIYWGLSPLSFSDFINVPSTDLINNGEVKQVNGDSINTLVIQQNVHIHYLIIPINLVDIIKSLYTSSGIESVLWDNNTQSGFYRTNYPNFEYNNIQYKVLYNYVIPDTGITPDINITLKNK